MASIVSGEEQVEEEELKGEVMDERSGLRLLAWRSR